LKYTFFVAAKNTSDFVTNSIAPQKTLSRSFNEYPIDHAMHT